MALTLVGTLNSLHTVSQYTTPPLVGVVDALWGLLYIWFLNVSILCLRRTHCAGRRSRRPVISIHIGVKAQPVSSWLLVKEVSLSVATGWPTKRKERPTKQQSDRSARHILFQHSNGQVRAVYFPTLDTAVSLAQYLYVKAVLLYCVIVQ